MSYHSLLKRLQIFLPLQNKLLTMMTRCILKIKINHVDNGPAIIELCDDGRVGSGLCISRLQLVTLYNANNNNTYQFC